MKRKTRSILDEISSMVPEKDRVSVIESRANHAINNAVNILEMIQEHFDEDTALELERRLLNSIKNRDSSKFARSIRKHR